MNNNKYNRPRRSRLAKANTPSPTFNSERPEPDPSDMALVDVENPCLTEPDAATAPTREPIDVDGFLALLDSIPLPTSNPEPAAPDPSDVAVVDPEDPCPDEPEAVLFRPQLRLIPE